MSLWQQCLEQLESQLNAQQFNTWIRPLQAVEDNGALRLLAPNRFVLDWVNERFFDNIQSIISKLRNGEYHRVTLEIGSIQKPTSTVTAISPTIRNITDEKATIKAVANADAGTPIFRRRDDTNTLKHVSNLRDEYTFSSFVEGKSNHSLPYSITT